MAQDVRFLVECADNTKRLGLAIVLGLCQSKQTISRMAGIE